MKGADLDDWDWLVIVLAGMLLIRIITVVANVSIVRLLELCFFEGCGTAFPTR